MNDDRKLLELAAKAAGIDRVWYEWDMSGEWGLRKRDDTEGGLWNPLLDDGDALRLAVKLRLQVSSARRVVVSTHSKSVEIAEEFGSDDCAATRRAIVRAAAEIGKAMP